MNLIAEDYARGSLRSEKDLGFDVYYFPICDFSAPDKMEEMDDALSWINE